MKLYLFYQTKDNEGNLIDSPRLYAITDVKSNAEEFQKTRRSDIFYSKVIELKKKDALTFMSKHNACVITKSTLKSFSDFEKKIPVLMTWGEEKEVVVRGMKNIMTLMRKYLKTPKYFSRKGLNILKAIDYIDFYETLGMNEFYNFDILCDVEKQVDEFKIFFILYGWMF